MATFAFYRFKLNDPSCTKETFAAFEPEKRLDLIVSQRKKDGSYEDNKVVTKCYNNDVLTNHEDILVMTIENNKQKATTIDKQKVQHEHHPFCHVIIDYREGHNIIAIERNGAFDNKPEKVRDILFHGLNRIFYRQNLTIELTPLAKSYKDIMEAIEMIRRRHHDRVKKICLDFNSKHNPNRQVDTNSITTAMALLADKANAKGLVAFQSEGDEEMDINAIQQELLAIADICYREGEYDLSIHFYSYGIFRYGADVVAQFGVDQSVIDEFVNQADSMDADRDRDSLPNWLDKMKDTFSDYNEQTVATIEPKRGRRK